MRPTSLVSLVLLTLGLLPQAAHAQAVATAPPRPAGAAAATATLPRVRLVATGGTIRTAMADG